MIGKEKIALAIKELIDVQAADSVTLTFDASDALQLADDLLWCARSTGREYKARLISGSASQ